MKVIERKMLEAIKNGKCFHNCNTSVSFSGNKYRVYLYDTCIAKGVKGFYPSHIQMNGWTTRTTLSRVRALNFPIKNVGTDVYFYNTKNQNFIPIKDYGFMANLGCERII